MLTAAAVAAAAAHPACASIAPRHTPSTQAKQRMQAPTRPPCSSRRLTQRVQHALGLPGGARRVQHERRRLRIQPHGLAVVWARGNLLVPPHVAPGRPRRLLPARWQGGPGGAAGAARAQLAMQWRMECTRACARSQLLAAAAAARTARQGPPRQAQTTPHAGTPHAGAQLYSHLCTPSGRSPAAHANSKKGGQNKAICSRKRAPAQHALRDARTAAARSSRTPARAPGRGSRLLPPWRPRRRQWP